MSLENFAGSIMVTGASSTGKSTLVRLIVDTTSRIRLPGDTTRLRRDNEIEGFDYNYLENKEIFLEKFFKGLYIDPNLEVTKYNNCYYGSPIIWMERSLDRKKLSIFTPTSTITAKFIKENCGKDLLWVHLFTSDLSRKERLTSRAISKEEVIYRLSHGDSQGINAYADQNIDTTNIDVNELQEIVLKSNPQEL